MQGRKIPTLAPQQALRFPATFLRGLIEQESSVTLRLEWEKFRHRQKMAIWPELMIKTLQYHPEKAMKVLAGTYAQEPFPPPYAMSDCLNFIISHFLGRPGPHSTNFVRRLCNYIFRLLRIGPKEYFHISQHAIFLLLSKADSYCIKKLYETLSDLHHPLHQNTLMNFASRLAERRETDTAFEILRKLKSYDCDFNSPKMLSLCSSVLDRSNRGPTTSHSESDIFEYMLECGMQPNLITYNILIQNSLENENHSTAWQIHDMMLESGIEPDVYTYSILLNNSKRRRDSADIRKVMDMVEEKGMRNSYIITDILHAIFLLHQQRTRTSGQPHEPQTAFHHMLKVFLENFHIRPLVRIIPWISQESPESQMLETSPTIQAKFEHPPAPTLAVMITAFLHGLQSPRSVKQCYDHFRYLLSTGDPVLADLIQTTHIWNSFLMAFGRSRSTLEDCPMVIGDMFAPIHAASMTASSLPTDEIDRESAPGTNPISETHYSSSMVGVSEAESSKGLVQPLHASISAQDSKLRELENSEERPRKPHIPPKPDVYTWSILLKIFMDQRQTRAAERVLAMMQERGIQPNLVTWNTLAVGYARLQEERMTVDAISRLRGSGLTPDDITMASLRRIRDRRTLLEAMKRKEQKESKEEKDLLDRLIDDVRNVTDKELPLDFESADEDFVISDMKGFDDDMTMERIVDDSATQKEGGEEVETI
jgi:pentatricopeptide repeat protein